MKELLSPPVAFLVYLVLVYGLYHSGKKLAPSETTAAKIKTYSSGEASPTKMAEPGYRPFFVVAFFFAILHLGILVLGSGTSSLIAGVYLVGLVLALLALVLG